MVHHHHPHLHHGHDHPHPPQGAGARVLYWALGATLGFAAIEALGGWYAGSLALLGDAAHMVSDATALGIAAFAAWLATHPPSHRHSYGYVRAEAVAALVNGVLMLAVVVGIVVAAVERIRSPQPVAGLTVMVVAALGLVINVAVALMLSRGEEDMNVRGALLHVFGDLAGSVAALLSGAVIYFTGWTLVDPILSVFICLLILYSSLRLLRDVLLVLMEGVPAHLELPEVGRAMARSPGVRSVHDLHIWTLATGRVALSAHIVIDNLQAWPDCLEQVSALLAERFAIVHVTLQPEIATEVRVPMPRTGREEPR